MGVFHAFKIKQMVPNRATHRKYLFQQKYNLLVFLVLDLLCYEFTTESKKKLEYNNMTICF